MIANPRHQLYRVGQLDQIVVGAGGKRGAFDRRIFAGGQHDDRDVAGGRVGAILAHQGQTVNAWHHQVLQDDCGTGSLGGFDRLVGMGAVVEIDVNLIRQCAPDGFTHHGLVIHQQHHDRIIVRRLIDVEI